MTLLIGCSRSGLHYQVPDRVRPRRVPLHEVLPFLDTAADRKALLGVKVVHTIVWAFFVLCIAAIPVLAWRGKHVAATWFVGIVFVEVLVIVLNRWRCPLTPLAARFTEDRRANFDIFLPEWLARHNKTIFGVLYFAGIVYLVLSWATRRP